MATWVQGAKNAERDESPPASVCVWCTRAHELGESQVFETPISYLGGMCLGIQDPARIWVTHCAAGLPSWERDNPEVYRIHCISRKGTVWEFERVEDPEG